MTTSNNSTDNSDQPWRKTACILCECNCGLEVKLDDRKLSKIRGDKEHPDSAGYTCEKPLRLDFYQNGPHRLTSPLRRTATGDYEEIDWDTALDEIAERLRAVVVEHGGESIFFYGGGGQGNHLGGSYGRSLFSALGARYMSNALAQEKTGEAWVDQQLYGNHTSGDFDNTEVAIFIGKNPWQSHGLARARAVLREISRDPNRAIVVIDPRRSETADIADYHLQIRPGTDAWCVSAIVAVIAQENLYDSTFLAAHTTGSDIVLSSLQSIDVTAHARRCGVDETLIREAARRIASAESAATYEDLGVQQSPNSTVVAYLNKMMWMLTGNFGKPGGMHIHSWMVPITGRWHPIPSNERLTARRPRHAVGQFLMRTSAPLIRRLAASTARHPRTASIVDRGAALALDAIFEAVSVDTARLIADALGRPDVNGYTPVSGARIQYGLTPCNAIADEILTDHPARQRAMWIDASNPAHSLAESGRFADAMRALDLTVVIDVAMTETAQLADYVLPAASQFEKIEASLFTLHFPHNTFQVRRPLTDPLPGTRDEPWIYAQIIDRLGVVDEVVIDDLAAAAHCGSAAFAAAFFSTIEAQPQYAGLVPYLLYRTLGTTFAEAEQPLALIWGMAHLAAIAQPDAVARAGFADKGFARGEQLFEAIRSQHHGVKFTDDRYSDAWGYIQHADSRIHMNIPMLLRELAEICDVEPPQPSSEFPLILSAGERRAFTANVIIRNPQWRRRDTDGALRISPADATELGIETGSAVRLVTEAGSARATIEVSDMMQNGHVSLPNGMGVTYPSSENNGTTTVGVPLNTLTSAARRDKFFGSPWHKYIPARIETDSPN